MHSPHSSRTPRLTERLHLYCNRMVRTRTIQYTSRILRRPNTAPPAQHVCGEASEAAGSMLDGNVRHGARLLRSSIRHLSAPYQLTPSPRGSFSSLTKRILPALLPGPDEVSQLEQPMHQCVMTHRSWGLLALKANALLTPLG